MTSDDNDENNSYNDKQRANWAIKIVATSIAVGIALSFLIGYIINGGWR